MINFIKQGVGPPVILIHGLAASLYDWNDLIPALVGASYSVYALDLLGHGQSEKPDKLDDYNAANFFASFCQWIDSLQLSEPHILVGHSLGGYLALQYALQYPAKVKALILSDPLFSRDQLPFFLRFNYRGQLINTTLIERTPVWIFQRIIDLTSLSIRNGFVLSEKVRAQTAADYKRAHPGIFNVVHSISDFTPLFSSIKQPTLVIWGSNDQTLKPESFKKLLNKMPEARGDVIIGAGHVPHQSHPAQFNALVMQFLLSLEKNKREND